MSNIRADHHGLLARVPLLLLKMTLKMAYAETSRIKQNRNSKSASPSDPLEKALSDLTLEAKGSSKDSKSLIQRERSPVAGNRYSRYSGLKPRTSAVQKSPNLNPRGGRPPQRQVTDQHKPQRTVVPKSKGLLAPKGYTMRPIIPASKPELLPVARAMHGDDFAPRVKKLFDPEREAAIDAIQSGVYIGWRCPEFQHDCIRVCKSSKCFCGHLLSDHASYTGKSVMVPCGVTRCECKAFAFIPSRPVPKKQVNFGFNAARDMTRAPGEPSASVNILMRSINLPDSGDAGSEAADAPNFSRIFCVVHATDTGKNMKPHLKRLP